MKKQLSNYDFIKQIKNNYNGDNLCKEILTQYLKYLIEHYPEHEIHLTPKKHAIYLRNFFSCFGVSISHRTKSILFTNRSKKNNVFFEAFKNIRPTIRSKLHKDYMDKYKTDSFILENEITVVKILISLLETKQIKLELNEREQNNIQCFDYTLRITDLSKENLTPEQRRERMILDYVNGHDLKEDDCNKLYDYISTGMRGNHGSFRVRNQNECNYNKMIAPNARFVIIPNKIEAGYTTHIIKSFVIAITNNNKCIWDFSFYSKIDTHIIIENDMITIPDDIFIDIINKVDYLNGNNKNLINHEEYTLEGNDIGLVNYDKKISRSNLLKTIFSSSSALNVTINVERCKQEGLIFPKIIRKHIEKRFNNCIRCYDIHRKSKELFDPVILKIVLGFVRSPRLYDYNWLCGTLSVKSYNDRNHDNLVTTIPDDIRSRNRIQAIKTFSGLYDILQYHSIEIDNGINIDSILKNIYIPKKMKKYFSYSFKQLINKRTQVQKKINKDIPNKEMDNEISLINKNIDIHNVFINKNRIFKFVKHPFDNSCIHDFYLYLNRLFATFDDMNTLDFYKIFIDNDNMLNIFFYTKENNIYIKPINMKNVSLGKTQQEISNNIDLLAQASDILIQDRNFLYTARQKPFNDNDFNNILIYGTEICLSDIIKQSKEFHKNIEYIQTALSNLTKRFSVAIPPEEQNWEKIIDDISYPDGHISFFVNREELIKEGKKMKHCVGGYGTKCVYDYRTHIASIVDNDGNFSTIEYYINNDNKVNIVQNRNVENKKPSKACEEIGLKTVDLIQKKLTPDFLEFLKDEAEKRKEKRKDVKNNNYITEIYKQELLDLGYEHYNDYLKTEKYNILKPYLNKTFRKMTYNEACEYIQRVKDTI